jgi:predicted MPP superfamily phosphohydrolase
VQWPPSRTSRFDEKAWLEARLGAQHAYRRAELEQAAEPPEALRGQRSGLSFSSVAKVVIPRVLKSVGMLARGRANATRIEVTRNVVPIAGLPRAFDGFTLLHLTDLHADLSTGAMRALPQAIAGLRYDVCVITGDFRGRTFGPFDKTFELVQEMLENIPSPVLGVLGNHDSARMLPGLEAMGIRMLMNENHVIELGSSRIWIAGVDDPHYYRLDDSGKALAGVPDDEVVVLLSHSTDVLDRAGSLGVNLLLCGHTHGGQICLPGPLPVLTSSSMPRRLASGGWRQDSMHGYTSRGIGTSLLDVRFNCPPEVTLHTLMATPAI